jgi:hypothetical protein
VDSDCTLSGDVGCYFTCAGSPVSTAGEEAAQQSILESTAPVCAELTRRCGPRGPVRCPAAIVAVGCNDGTCQGLSCNDLQSRVLPRLDEIQEQAARNCAVDADCALISTEARCTGGCGRWASVQAVSADQVTQLLQNAKDTICNQYQAQGCRSPAPPCPQQREDPRAACIAGKCDIAYVPAP